MKKSRSFLLFIVLLLLLLCIVLFFAFVYKKNTVNESFTNEPTMCMIYNYYEKDELYKENFEYFLKHGILDEIDYYIVVNGKTDIDITEKSNIHVYFRENIGFDFGAYSYTIPLIQKPYDYYFFANTSVRGPYLKNDADPKWYNRFIELFQDDVHIVGTSINICTYEPLCGNLSPHVQTMFFVLDKQYFNELVNDNFFNEEQINKMEMHSVIREKEVGLSKKALEKGYNINCLLSKYKGLDYRNIDKDINHTSRIGDPYYVDGYFGETIDPYEVIFFKTNRLTPPPPTPAA